VSRLLIGAVTAATVSLLTAGAHAEPTYRVLIDSKPRGADVYIDSLEDGAVGETPYRTKLTPGEHTIIVERDGFSRQEQVVDIEPTRKLQKVRFTLRKLVKGTVDVSAPSGDAAIGAVVKIDGVEVGTVPDQFEVEVGPHVVEVSAAGAEPFEDWIEVVEGETVQVSPELGPGGGDDDDGGGDGDLGGGDEGDGDDEDDEDDEGGDEDASVSRAARRPGVLASALVVLDTGVDIGGRHFSYKGVVTEDNLRPYDADGVPLLHVGAEIYPLAGSGTTALRMIGAIASFDRSFALTSSTSDNVEVATTWSQMEIGGRLRYALGDALFGGVVAYGQTAVTFSPPAGSPATLAEQVPEVDYRYVRLGADVRYQDGSVGYMVGGSGLVVSSAGTSAERFRDYNAAGFGLRAGFSIGLMPKVEARVVGRYDFFSSAFAASTGDEYVATGASDHIYGIIIGGAYIY